MAQAELSNAAASSPNDCPTGELNLLYLMSNKRAALGGLVVTP